MYGVRLLGPACTTAVPEPLADPLTAECSPLPDTLAALLTASALADADAIDEEIRPESVSRRNLFRSARISAAD